MWDRDRMDLELLGPELRAIAERVIAARPACTALVRVEVDRGHPLVIFRSPTDEDARRMVLWDEDGDLGLEFGGWHTHGNIACWTRDAGDEVASLTAITLAIIDGELVTAVDVGGAHDGSLTTLDLAEPDALLEALTSRFSPGRMRIETWSGTGDREVSLEDVG